VLFISKFQITLQRM